MATNLNQGVLSTDLSESSLSTKSNSGLQTSDQQMLKGSSGQGRNVLIFVADGLRPSSVNPTDAPTLSSLRETGVNFTNSHSLFPTFTTPNASAIATGHYLGDTGDFSNTIYTGYPVFNGTNTPFIENDPILGDIDDHFGGNYLNEETLLAYARQNGYDTAAVGKQGPTLIQDVTQGNLGADGKVAAPTTTIIDDSTGRNGGIPLADDISTRLTAAGLPTVAPTRGANGVSGNNTTPGTLVANIDQQKYFTDAVTEALLPKFKADSNPFAMVYWSRDPDGTQHNQGDSLNSLTPGINGPTSKAAVKNADTNLSQIIQGLKDQGLYDNTDIFITSDHGFSTISKRVVDNQGTTVNDYASSLSFAGVNQGYLPGGFVAIDIAHDLNQPLYDPDTQIKDSSGKNAAYTLVNPQAGERPAFGDGLIGGSGQIKDQTDAKVVVAANGGSDLIYIPDGDAETFHKVVDFLSKQNYTSGLFVDTKTFGDTPGTLSLDSINLQGSTSLPKPAIVLNFKTFSTDPSNPTGSQVEIADTNLQQGQGMHGSFGRGDTYNNMIAIGPDFKQSYTDLTPVSNADVATTLASVLGFDIPSNGDLKGRVINEAIAGNPDNTPYTTGILKSDPTSDGTATYLDYQDVNGTKYFDAAGYRDRTVGLSTSKHVLLLSIDGLHAADLADPKLQSDIPNILNLASTGVTYTNGTTTKPSDSFPGTLSYLTGAGPATTGVYYDNSYDRSLIAPGGNANSPQGTQVLFDESIDKNPDLLSGGGGYGVSSIDPTKLPLDSNGNFIYPHNYPKVNTIFDVAKAAGLYTAFSDKHPAYDLVTGPNGNAVDDLYTPEIAAKVAIENGKLVDKSTAQNPSSLTFKGVTSSVTTTEAYDDLKVKAILNETQGLNSFWNTKTEVPSIYGMNFQALSVAQKDLNGGIAADGTPSAELEDALKHTDQSVGQIVAELKKQGLFDSTLVVLTAKHGQNPRLGAATLIKDDIYTNALQSAGIEVAQATQDDVSLLWLKDPSQASDAANVLNSLKDANPQAAIDTVYSGDNLTQAGFGNSSNRTPDLIVKLQPGNVLVGNPATSTKRAEHGGLSEDDTHVGLIVGGDNLPSNIQGTQVADPVSTTQIAVTALKALGLNPDDLQGAVAENTQPLPQLQTVA